MTLHRLVPSDVDAECLADLLEDIRAIPAAAFAPSRIVIPDNVTMNPDSVSMNPDSVSMNPDSVSMNIASPAREPVETPGLS